MVWLSANKLLTGLCHYAENDKLPTFNILKGSKLYSQNIVQKKKLISF